MWRTSSWCSSQASGLWLWGGRDNFRTLVHRDLPAPHNIKWQKSPRDLDLNTKTQHLFHPFKSAPWIPLEELLLLQHGLLHEIVNYMSCPPSEVKNQLRSLFMNFESCTKWQRMKKRLTFTRSRLEDGVIPVALVPACLLQLPIHSFNSHSFIQYPSN